MAVTSMSRSSIGDFKKSNTISGQVFLATGGTQSIIEADGYQYSLHAFTTSGTLTVLRKGTFEYYVVGGGGSGGYRAASNGGVGGGGAGGLVSGSVVLEPGSVSVVVGSGGVAVTVHDTAGNNGVDSSFGSITATGGGGGGTGVTNAKNGGSGGGAGSTGTTPNEIPGHGSSQGNDGGRTTGASQGAGGGGYGSRPGNNVENGGDSIDVSLWLGQVATTTYLAGGGAGSQKNNAYTGGTGSGGNSGITGTPGSQGVDGTGGGGGSGFDIGTSYDGGDGVVYVRYRL